MLGYNTKFKELFKEGDRFSVTSIDGKHADQNTYDVHCFLLLILSRGSLLRTTTNAND